MLQNLRDKTQGWITRLIIGLVCVAFILWGVHSFMMSAGPAAGYLARVNGQDISASEFGATYQRLLQERQAQLGANFVLTPAIENKIKAVAMEQLITTTALAQAAEKNHFRFTPKQVGDVIGGISTFQDNGHFSPTKFTQMITALGFTEDGFFNNVRQAMLINQLRFGLIESSFALPVEVNQANELVNQKRDFSYLQISPTAFADKVKIDDAMVKNYYQTHQDEFTSAPTVVLQYLLLSMPEIVKKTTVTSAQLTKYYQENLDRYGHPPRAFKDIQVKVKQDYVQDKANHVYADNIEQLNNLTYTNPQSLEPAAKALGIAVQTSPEIVSNKPADGVFANPQLKEVAFSKDVLAGNNSTPVTLDDTHVIVVRAIKHQAEQVKPLAEVKAQIVKLLQQQKMQELANTEAQNILNGVVAGASLQDAAAKATIPLIVSNQAGMTRHAAVTNALNIDAFQLPRPGHRPSVGLFKLPSGNLAVIQVLKITNASSDEAQSAMQQRVMNQQITNAYAQMDYQIYATGVLASAKINIPQSATPAANNEE